MRSNQLSKFKNLLLSSLEEKQRTLTSILKDQLTILFIYFHAALIMMVQLESMIFFIHNMSKVKQHLFLRQHYVDAFYVEDKLIFQKVFMVLFFNKQHHHEVVC